MGAILYGLVTFQSFHMVEHAMLFIQAYVEGLVKPTGILELLFNDTLVQVHFVFNLILYAFLLLALMLYNQARGDRAWLLNPIPKLRKNILLFDFALYGLFVFQTVHMFDHSLQYLQYYVLGTVNPNGLFGQFINESNIVIHLFVNGIILSGLVMAALSYRRISKHTGRAPKRQEL